MQVRRRVGDDRRRVQRGSKHFELIAFPEAVAELHDYAFSAFFANSRDGADGFYVARNYGATHFADR